jgi:plasmid stabilization system protein ParE
VRPSRRLRWSRLADLDLQAAHAFLAARSPEAARRFAVEVLEAVHHLQEFPEMGATAADLLPAGRYRHYVCGRHRIVYRIDSEVIWILRVWDSRRNPADLKPE